MKIGDRLKELRIKHNLTQDQLAEKLFVARQTVSKWELGVNEPDIETLQKLAQLFDVSVAELIEANTTQPATPLYKKLFIANALLFVFCMLSVFVLWRFLPKRIPAHYNIQGQIDRYGDSAEVLLHIASFLALFAIEAIICFAYRKSHVKESNVVSVVMLVIVAAYWIFVFVLHGLNIEQNVMSMINCLVALAIFIVGVAMHPGICKQNSILGVRTHLTLSDGIAWNKVNRFAAFTVSVTAMAILTLNMILTTTLTVILSSLIYLPCFAAIAVYHRLVAKNIAKTKPENAE